MPVTREVDNSNNKSSKSDKQDGVFNNLSESDIDNITDDASHTPIHEESDDNNIGKHLDATQLYLNEIGFSPLLSPQEEVYFARLALGDEAGRKRMIESNLRLVVKIARRYVNRGLTLLDLIEEGTLV